MKNLKNKNVIITILMIVAFCLILMGITGCEVIDEQPKGNDKTEETRPLTKQICDWWGYSSSSIIKEQAEQGYVFTGVTKGFFCNTLLNFQLKEAKDENN